MYYPFVRKALFQLDPERAHEFTFQAITPHYRNTV